MLKEGAQESGLALHGLTGTASGFGQAAQGGRRMVGQRVLLQITPNVFHGIEFGGVGREVFQIEAEMAVKERFDFPGPVRSRAIPDHQDVSWQLAEQLQEQEVVAKRWGEMLECEARIIESQPAGPRMHSGI